MKIEPIEFDEPQRSGITVKDLSTDQLEAYKAITQWMLTDNPPVDILTLGGYAGVGKSTLVSLIADQVDLPAFCAYTGKASGGLKRKLAVAGTQTTGTQKRGEDGARSLDQRPYCGTIHSLIYRPCECREPTVETVEKPCPECGAETRWDSADPTQVERIVPLSVCANGHIGAVKTEAAFNKLKRKTRFIRAKIVDGVCTLCGNKGWLRREELDRNYGLIIVDEASMVDDIMLRDLQSYHVPILAVGDHGQLPPVGGHGSLMKNPMLRLEKIHRQAEGNPIILLSKIIRETGRLPDELPGDAVQFRRLRQLEMTLEERYADASPERLLEMGLICYTNRRRLGLNTSVRRIRGTARTGRELPQAGEHVVCLRNMKGTSGAPPIYNGMRGRFVGDVGWKTNVNAKGEKISESSTHLEGTIEFPEDEVEGCRYEMLAAQFGREKTFGTPEELAAETGLHSFAMAGSLFDFGYAMTCHKMQGSQVDDLAVCVERPGPVSEDDWRRWLYTSVTRASKKLTLLKP